MVHTTVITVIAEGEPIAVDTEPIEVGFLWYTVMATCSNCINNTSSL